MSPPRAADLATAMAMVPLLERGSEALRSRLNEIPKTMRPIGTSIDVVTEADFIANPMTVLRHVCRNGSPTHVFCADLTICALIAKHRQNW